MTGKIIKGIAGFYYVHIKDYGIYECKAKGKFRNNKIKPLVGDNVEVDILDSLEKKGNIVKILSRENDLIRPLVANVDQAMIVFAVKKPDPNLNLLDRFLVMMEYQNIETIICFNKIDIGNEKFMEELKNTYNNAGYKVLFASATENEGVEEIKKLLYGKCDPCLCVSELENLFSLTPVVLQSTPPIDSAFFITCDSKCRGTRSQKRQAMLHPGLTGK